MNEGANPNPEYGLTAGRHQKWAEIHCLIAARDENTSIVMVAVTQGFPGDVLNEGANQNSEYGLTAVRHQKWAEMHRVIAARDENTSIVMVAVT